MERGASAASVLRMTSWPVLIILTLALLLALASYWLRVDALATESVEPASIVQAAPAQPSNTILESSVR